MRLGIIDLGTNSVRFDIHLVNLSGQVRLLYREKLMIRLGEGVFLKNKLNPNAVHRTIHAFRSFKRTASLFHAERIIAFGTSALREALDATVLIELIQKTTGIDIRVISGEEEAQLIALGILTHEKPIKSRFALIDIGGGSTEISICREKRVLHSASFPLGVARLQQLFLKVNLSKSSDPGKAQVISSFRKYVKTTLLPKILSEDWPQVTKIVGSSGTIRALERILKKLTGKNGINRRDLSKLVHSMSSLTPSQLIKIPGMEPKRIDLILSGGILLEECMEALDAKELSFTPYSLRDGILNREIQLLSPKKEMDIQFQLESLYSKAKKLGCPESHMKQVMSLAETLFERTRNVHQLSPRWKRYLSAAAILHDVGSMITPTHHELHSYYIIKNADFPSMEKWESEFIAQLCLKHNSGTLSKKDLDFAKTKSEKNTFLWLLAILRLADSLDRGHKSKIKIHQVKIDSKEVKLTLSARGSIALEILRAEQKKALFEKVFKRKLTVTAPTTKF